MSGIKDFDEALKSLREGHATSVDMNGWSKEKIAAFHKAVADQWTEGSEARQDRSRGIPMTTVKPTHRSTQQVMPHTEGLHPFTDTHFGMFARWGLTAEEARDHLSATMKAFREIGLVDPKGSSVEPDQLSTDPACKQP